jgi:hypothetical protein
MLVKTGVVYKKKGGMMSSAVKRQLTLTNQPRLFFSNPETQEYKSDLLITPFLQAVLKGPDKFDIICKKSGKQYTLKVVNNEAE